MNYRFVLAAFLVAASCASLGHAGILEDFRFDDPNGTLLGDAANSANPANKWFATDPDITESAVLNGSYRIQKQNQELGDAFLQIDNITSGRAWIVTEFAGWSFNPNPGDHDFNAAELEEVRLAFLDNDTGTSGSTITGQVQIQRNAAGGLELVGALLTSGPDLGPVPLTLNRSTPFTMVVEIDEDSNEYSVYYKDGAAPYVSLGSFPHVATRDGNSIRFRMNNSFGGTDEFVDIDRIYLTNSNPIPEPATVWSALLALGGLLGSRRRA